MSEADAAHRPVLVTGAAGFIGSHISRVLLERGEAVVGVDSLNDYYDPALKEARLAWVGEAVEGAGRGGGGFADEGGAAGGTGAIEVAGASAGAGDAVADLWRFERLDLTDRRATEELFEAGGFDRVIHLAAQPGVRYSLEAPHAYLDSNLAGLLNVLEGCRHGEVEHLVFASSSSVYGDSPRTPFSVHDPVDHPVSLYAATKRAGELMAHTYGHLYDVPITALRYFTVYGPWGRPDMAYYLFARAIREGEPIDVFNEGRMRRSFTYVDDAVEATLRALESPPTPDPAAEFEPASERPDPATSWAPFRIYNVGNRESVPLLRFIEVIEEAMGAEAEKNLLPMQPGDVHVTEADVDDAARDFGFEPTVPLEEGIRRFVEWFREHQGR